MFVALCCPCGTFRWKHATKASTRKWTS